MTYRLVHHDELWRVKRQEYTSTRQQSQTWTATDLNIREAMPASIGSSSRLLRIPYYENLTEPIRSLERMRNRHELIPMNRTSKKITRIPPWKKYKTKWQTSIKAEHVCTDKEVLKLVNSSWMGLLVRFDISPLKKTTRDELSVPVVRYLFVKKGKYTRQMNEI